jgi:hypothetical protein
MDLNNKLKGLPTIYYTNLDNRTDRREWMESQFDHWKIKNFVRVSGTKYLASRHEEWKDKYVGEGHAFGQIQHTANAITHLEMIKNWLETTDEKYMIMMEDDTDLFPIEYWNFDWEYLMNNIPYDWDCIQFSSISKKYMKFFLYPKPATGTFFGPCLINRHYAEKLIRLHYIEDYRINLNMKTKNKMFMEDADNKLTVDYFICENGRTYIMPLLTAKHFPSYENYILNYGFISHLNILNKIFYAWWENDHHKFTLDEFFTYGKPNDELMTRCINPDNFEMEKIKLVMNIDYN